MTLAFSSFINKRTGFQKSVSCATFNFWNMFETNLATIDIVSNFFPLDVFSVQHIAKQLNY
jgi:hypothetical protein